jgi:hypothetical protein|tara:strand:- start:355 stop:1209 length:855 start_codon:yes stop_codon:yes gene_type:complete
MNKKVKHTKIKNTGILFELLTRQITADLLGSNDSKAAEIVKEFFNKDTELGKEFELYKILSENKYSTESRAEKLLEVVLRNRGKLSNSSIRSEKYNLIRKIKESYDINEFFNARIPNYKVLASIYNIFESSEETNPVLYEKSHHTLMENMTHDNVTVKKDKTYDYLKQQEKDLRLLAYQTLVEKFNKKYSNLSEKQKTLLKEYINNISNTNKLREYVDNEINDIKQVLSEKINTVDDKITKIKINEVVNQADSLKKGKVVSDKQVVSLMRYYQLIQEIDNVAKG